MFMLNKISESEKSESESCHRQHTLFRRYSEI